jgi:CRP-like cAMP-binding protein
MTNIGARPAYNRAAHLLCEFVVRLRAVGLANEHSCTFPLTQGDLGDAMGLSVVHVNRIFKELRGQKLIEFGARELTVLNWDGLKEVGEFDPGYLYLGGAESAAA